MLKWYVDKRTINNQTDKFGNGGISYRAYDTEIPWSEIKQHYTEDEIPHLLLVTDTGVMQELVDPGNKREITERKERLKSLINAIYDELCKYGDLTNSIVNQYNYDYESESEYEKSTYDIQYKEAKDFSNTNYSDLKTCPNILKISIAANRDIIDLANKIILKHETQVNRAIKYLGYKQKNISFIENQNNINKIREMFADYKWIDFSNDITIQQVYEYVANQAGRFDYYNQF